MFDVLKFALSKTSAQSHTELTVVLICRNTYNSVQVKHESISSIKVFHKGANTDF